MTALTELSTDMARVLQVELNTYFLFPFSSTSSFSGESLSLLNLPIPVSCWTHPVKAGTGVPGFISRTSTVGEHVQAPRHANVVC